MTEKTTSNNLKKVQDFANDFVKNQSQEETLIIIYSDGENILKVNASKPTNAAECLSVFLDDNKDIVFAFKKIIDRNNSIEEM